MFQPWTKSSLSTDKVDGLLQTEWMQGQNVESTPSSGELTKGIGNNKNRSVVDFCWKWVGIKALRCLRWQKHTTKWLSSVLNAYVVNILFFSYERSALSSQTVFKINATTTTKLPVKKLIYLTQSKCHDLIRKAKHDLT